MADGVSLAGAESNENIWRDQKRVIYAVLALLGMALVQTVLGVLTLGQTMKFSGASSVVLGSMSLLAAVLLYAMALGTYFNRSIFAGSGAAVGALLALFALFSLNPVLIVINVVGFLWILQGYWTLRSMDRRIAEADQSHPAVDYYHRLIPLLVRVMAADGHLDRRERKKIYTLCDSMKISRYEQQTLVRQSLKYADNAIAPLIDGYLAVARKIGFVTPDRKLLSAALAVASVDGVLAPEEVALLKTIGQHLHLPDSAVDAMLHQQKARLEHIDAAAAAQILDVPSNATAEQINEAYRSFLQDFEAEQYASVGQKLLAHIQRRKQAVERAYEVLQGRAAAG